MALTNIDNDRTLTEFDVGETHHVEFLGPLLSVTDMRNRKQYTMNLVIIMGTPDYLKFCLKRLAFEC